MSTPHRFLSGALLGALWALGCSGAPAADGGHYATTLPDGGTATWYRDVLPVANLHCKGCHTAGGIGPFALDDYDTAKTWAGPMAAAVAAKRMPPWMPSDTCGPQFKESRRLDQASIDVFTAWNAAGAPAGHPEDAPLSEPILRSLEWVDQELTYSVAYTPRADLTDDYHCFAIDPGLATAQDVIGYEVVPGVRAQVHHVLVYAVDAAAAKAADDKEPGEGWTCFGGPGTEGDMNLIGGWAPGSPAITYPSGTGIKLEAGKVLAMQIHYNTAAAREPDVTKLKLQFARRPVTTAYLVPLADASFLVPPNAMGFTPSSHPKNFPNIFGFDVKVWGAFPHMHQAGREIRVDGPQGCVIDIPKWDFHWQQQYFFTRPLTVKADEAVKMSCTWDNPTSKYLHWGEGTEDEMCLTYLYLTP
ncbi:MAG: hypothetical protein K1X64_09420 [Myxococcaceae bacterium]|nr:hypothetical protein [Myxococcaceae bacterium]